MRGAVIHHGYANIVPTSLGLWLFVAFGNSEFWNRTFSFSRINNFSKTTTLSAPKPDKEINP